MSRRRFHAPPTNFDFATQTLRLGADETRHLRDVLRLKTGDDAYVFDGAGREFRCKVVSVKRDTVELRIEEEAEPAKAESPLTLTLGVALLKGEKFDLAVQKTTELGVNRVVPLMTRYADIHLRDEADASKRVARWQRIALEAAKQSGRAVAPQVSAPIAFETFVSGTKEAALRLMFSERGGSGLSVLTGRKTQVVTAVVGSEGGWSDEEIEQARAEDFQIVTLGGRILRAETAAVVVTSLLQHLFGDLK